jgi:hypothetical protein
MRGDYESKYTFQFATSVADNGNGSVYIYSLYELHNKKRINARTTKLRNMTEMSVMFYKITVVFDAFIY